ncbi:MAG: C39 family peptidase [Paenisporosarcina sp.]
MRVQLDMDGFSQYDDSINPGYHNSACGPVTAWTILSYWMPNSFPYTIDQLYQSLGATRIGLFTWRFKRNLRKLLGPDWTIKACSIEEAKAELLAGRPVACKFDRYFGLKWFNKYEFAYHWVPLIGFEEKEKGLTLILHDNGGWNRASQIRHVSYQDNKDILTFVKIVPHSNLIE